MHVIMNKGREFTTFSVSNFLVLLWIRGGNLLLLSVSNFLVFIVCLCFVYETDTDILMVNLSILTVVA